MSISPMSFQTNYSNNKNVAFTAKLSPEAMAKIKRMAGSLPFDSITAPRTRTFAEECAQYGLDPKTTGTHKLACVKMGLDPNTSPFALACAKYGVKTNTGRSGWDLACAHLGLNPKTTTGQELRKASGGKDVGEITQDAISACYSRS